MASFPPLTSPLPWGADPQEGEGEEEEHQKERKDQEKVIRWRASAALQGGEGNHNTMQVWPSTHRNGEGLGMMLMAVLSIVYDYYFAANNIGR